MDQNGSFSSVVSRTLLVCIHDPWALLPYKKYGKEGASGIVTRQAYLVDGIPSQERWG